MNLKRNQLKQRLGPGIWIDQNDNLHFSIPELLALVDLPDTPENRAAVHDMLVGTMRKAGIPAVVTREKPD
jgi:hypothetical protein